MPRLHALLVAINNYPEYRNRLRGCINDLEEMRTYLADFCAQQELEFNPHILIDDQASRANIIEGFASLRKAEDGDSVLFFYAGHGSRCPAPEAFWHLETDKMNESLVCWDSRLENGRDLIDKELSYLIWSVTKDKDITFVSITDCCHSGSNMRLESVNERRAGKSQQLLPVEQYLGFEHYQKVGEGQYQPPRGKYIHLAASQAHETAKELKTKGQQRGIFSFVLLETLKGIRSPIPYTELINRVRFRIRNYLQDQYPVLETSNHADKNLAFLQHKMVEKSAPYLISYNREKGWLVNAGHIHNLSSRDDIVFKLPDSSLEVKVTELFTDYATVSGMEEANKRQIYPALLSSQSLPRLSLAAAPHNETEGVDVLRVRWTGQDTNQLEWVDAAEGAHFWIHAKNGSYYLTSLQDTRPLFQRIEGYTPENADFFIAQTRQVAKWLQLQELQKPDTSIPLHALQIELYKGTQPGDYTDAAAAEKVDWREPATFVQEGGNPTFKLKLSNQSSHPMWVSVLYLGIDYSVTNQLLALERLEEGEEAWCSYVKQEQTIRTIPITLHDTYHSWGLTSATCYLKIIASTAPFDADQFNQKGLALEGYRGPERNIAIEPDPPAEDWRVYTVPLPIYRPLAFAELSAQTPASLFGHQLIAPPSFRAELRLQTLEHTCGEATAFPDLEIRPGVFLHPVELGPPQASPGLSVLALQNIKNGAAIREQTSLRIHFRAEMPALASIHAYAWERETNRFGLLPQTWEGDCLELAALPDGEEAVIFFFAEGG